MFVRTQKLEVSPEQLAVIEAALHTQSKILNVQARAGGNAARLKLNEVKKVLTALAQQKPVARTQTQPARWFGMSRIFG